MPKTVQQLLDLTGETALVTGGSRGGLGLPMAQALGDADARTVPGSPHADDLEQGLLDFQPEIPFASHLGFTLHRMSGGHSELHYEARPEHLNSFAVTHGGATMALLDVAMAMAVRSDTPGLGAVTIEMKTTFMQLARGPLVARGRLIHRTKSMAYAEGTVYDAEGRVCSHATGTFKYLLRRALPATGSDGAAAPAPLPTD